MLIGWWLRTDCTSIASSEALGGLCPPALGGLRPTDGDVRPPVAAACVATNAPVLPPLSRADDADHTPRRAPPSLSTSSLGRIGEPALAGAGRAAPEGGDDHSAAGRAGSTRSAHRHGAEPAADGGDDGRTPWAERRIESWE